MKTLNITFTTILFTIGYLTLCPITQAVNPPPDGGYAGGNTAEGQSALLSLLLAYTIRQSVYILSEASRTASSTPVSALGRFDQHRR